MYSDSKEYLKYLLQKNIIISTEEISFKKLNENVLNEDLDFNKLNKEFIENGFCVIDNILKKEFCERLQKFMLTINIREDIYNEYAAVNFDKSGKKIWFALLTNISDELKNKFNFLKNLNYQRGWSFIHSNSQNKSVEKHADPGSLITFNIWCTPDECILDNNEKYNGVVIYDTFNIDETDKCLKKIVSYKFNRAVVFDSRKIHESLVARFKDGYENRKINYTFLYK
jgi:hypothetical protein